MKTIGIVGSRKRNASQDYELVKTKFFELYEKGDWLCSGGCPQGGDRFAEQIAKEYGIPILIFYPNTKELGVQGFFVRNSEIANHSDVLIACVSKERKGGTEDTINKFISKPRGEPDCLFVSGCSCNCGECNLHLV